MSRVYQTAENVIIWLGTSNDQIDQLFFWMCRLDKDILTVLSPHTKLGAETWAQHWTYLLWRSNKTSPPDGIINALKEILRREWFSRIWVLQEAALARSAIVMCGRNSVSSRTFVVMPTLLGIKCSENEQSRLDVMPGPLRSGVNSWWQGPFFQDLDTLLRRFGKSKATDPRDIIYALLGLSADTFTSDVLRPDYELSLSETIQHTVLYLLHRRKYLQEFRVPTDLPIWDIDQLMGPLEDLPQHVFTWAVDQRKPALVASFISSGEDARQLQVMDEIIRGTRPPSVDMMSINSSHLDLMLQHRELYLVTSGSSGSWPFPVTVANLGGTALGPPLAQGNEADIDFEHLNTDSVILCIANRGESATVEVILNHPGLSRFNLDTDVQVSLATAARRGAQAFTVLLDQSTKVHMWRWREGYWFLNKGVSFTQSTLAEMLSDVSNALYLRASEGDTEFFREYLDARPGLVDMRWRQFRTPLGFAAEANNVTTATLLLDRGADIESRDLRRPFATPLWIAASQGHIETVQMLVFRGANIEVLAGEPGSPCTPLWIAASNGFEDVVLFLASMGANINASTWHSDRVRPAVGIAGSKLHFGVLQVLAKKGAEMGE